MKSHGKQWWAFRVPRLSSNWNGCSTSKYSLNFKFSCHHTGLFVLESAMDTMVCYRPLLWPAMGAIACYVLLWPVFGLLWTAMVYYCMLWSAMGTMGCCGLLWTLWCAIDHCYGLLWALWSAMACICLLWILYSAMGTMVCYRPLLWSAIGAMACYGHHGGL